MIKHQSNKRSGFTLVELIIAVTIVGILAGVLVQAVTGKSPKSDCLNAGGSWTEGMQFGRYSQFCTYPSNKVR